MAGNPWRAESENDQLTMHRVEGIRHYDQATSWLARGRLLRARRKRPRDGRAAEERDELAPLHFGHGDFLPDAHPAAYRRGVG